MNRKCLLFQILDRIRGSDQQRKKNQLPQSPEHLARLRLFLAFVLAASGLGISILSLLLQQPIAACAGLYGTAQLVRAFNHQPP